MALLPKQLEYLQNCNHRWNIKVGATGSGKSWMDYAVVVPKRLIALRGQGAAFDYTNSRKNAISDRVRHISKKLRSNRAELLICRAWPSSRRGTQETTPPALHHHLRYLLSVPHDRSATASG